MKDLLLPLNLDSVRLVGAVVELLQFALNLRPLSLSVMVTALLISGIIVRKTVIRVRLVAGLLTYLIFYRQFVDSQRNSFLRHFAGFDKFRFVLGDQVTLRCGEVLFHLLRQRKMDLGVAYGAVHAPVCGWCWIIRQIDGYCFPALGRRVSLVLDLIVVGNLAFLGGSFFKRIRAVAEQSDAGSAVLSVHQGCLSGGCLICICLRMRLLHFCN